LFASLEDEFFEKKEQIEEIETIGKEEFCGSFFFVIQNSSPVGKLKKLYLRSVLKGLHKLFKINLCW